MTKSKHWVELQSGLTLPQETTTNSYASLVILPAHVSAPVNFKFPFDFHIQSRE
jgi:hypothetical protein